MIRRCHPADFDSILDIINDGARAYRGVVPEDRLRDPYMSAEELQHEIDAGVVFWGFEQDDVLQGVMGIQQVQDVALIRHAYVRTGCQKLGLGGELLRHLMRSIDRPVLLGTWAAATWAIRFYERHGFTQVGPEEKNSLLRRYWTVPERQIETSVVLVDARYRDRA